MGIVQPYGRPHLTRAGAACLHLTSMDREAHRAERRGGRGKMSARRRVSLFVSLLSLGLCLIGAGCQLQIGFVDQSSKPPPPSQPQALATARPYEPGPTIQQTAGYGGYAAPP